MKGPFTAYLVVVCLSVKAQRQTFLNQHETSDNQLFINYENDLFAQRDRYYSQGIALGYKRLIKKPSKDHLIPAPFRYANFIAEHQVFTPSTIKSDTAFIGDRPYAALLRGTFIFEKWYFINGFRMGYLASLGVIGPQTGGKQMQTGIHKATNNPRPLGWQYQLPNALLIDFAAYSRQCLYDYRSSFSIYAFEWANLGTTNTDLTLGFDPSFTFQSKKSAVVLYARPAVRFVVYDGTLQGALFSPAGVVSVPSADLVRFVSEQELGLEFKTKHLWFKYYYRFQSPVFDGAKSHCWGGFQIAYAFRHKTK